MVRPRVRLRRDSLPMTALRLTPMSAAISRQERPASKCCLSSSMRSSVQVCEEVGERTGMCNGPRLQMSAIRLSRSVRLTFGARSRLAIVANRQKPVLDGETDAFLDQGTCDAGNAGAVGALSHQLLQIGDGRERQGYGNAVSLGFFGGHGRTLASYSGT